MNKVLRIILNILIFSVIIGFVWYMARSLGKQEPLFGSFSLTRQDEGVSAYMKVNTIKVKSDIISFELTNSNIYIALNQAVMITDYAGVLITQFPVGKVIRDIKVDDGCIYLLYPAALEVFTYQGEKIASWEARRNNSDYCAMALSSEYIYVTDAENKNICQYTKEGEFLSIILSPNGFVIPSFSFDIININDTIYCSNSGRLQIERFTLAGRYIDSFGKAGEEAGSFAGCCNPAYLAATQHGDILTSEKGVPRISCFGQDGQFRALLFGSKSLGGGTKAYRMKTNNDRIFVAGKNTLSEFVYDPQLAAQSSCAGCPIDCLLRKGL